MEHFEHHRQNTIDYLERKARDLSERARTPIQIERGVEIQHRDLDRRAAAAGSTVSWMDALSDDVFWEEARKVNTELNRIDRGLSRLGL